MPESFLRTCDDCGRRNRIPASHLMDRGHCGACSALLPPLSEPLDLDARTFDRLMAEVDVPVLLDFCAAWCGPCQAAAPVIAALAHELEGQALVLKVDTEKNTSLAARYAVRSIPSFVVLHRGRVVVHHAGLVEPHVMREWLEQAAGDERRV